MYGDNVSDIPFSSASWWLSPLGIDSATWRDLTRNTDTYTFGWSNAVLASPAPEPTSGWGVVAAGVLLIKRRGGNLRR
ncbi:MAG: hypothetical protein QM770_06130 [Tepidisphaeraceae bacterium]